MSITIVRGNEQFLRGYHAAQEDRDFHQIYEYLFRPEDGYLVYDFANSEPIIEEIVQDANGKRVSLIHDSIPDDIDYPLPDYFEED